jgi:hypothetical protein
MILQKVVAGATPGEKECSAWRVDRSPANHPETIRHLDLAR